MLFFLILNTSCNKNVKGNNKPENNVHSEKERVIITKSKLDEIEGVWLGEKDINQSISNKNETQKESLNCLTESDSLKIKNILADLINDLKTDKEESFSAKIVFPKSMFNFKFNNQSEFIRQWNLNDDLKNYLSLDVYDENDEYLKESTLENTKIIYSKLNDNCMRVQFGIGSGLIFTLGKIDNNIKIIEFDIAG